MLSSRTGGQRITAAVAVILADLACVTTGVAELRGVDDAVSRVGITDVTSPARGRADTGAAIDAVAAIVDHVAALPIADLGRRIGDAAGARRVSVADGIGLGTAGIVAADWTGLADQIVVAGLTGATSRVTGAGVAGDRRSTVVGHAAAMPSAGLGNGLRRARW